MIQRKWVVRQEIADGEVFSRCMFEVVSSCKDGAAEGNALRHKSEFLFTDVHSDP